MDFQQEKSEEAQMTVEHNRVMAARFFEEALRQGECGTC
jgi:hypothetical protein